MPLVAEEAEPGPEAVHLVLQVALPLVVAPDAALDPLQPPRRRRPLLVQLALQAGEGRRAGRAVRRRAGGEASVGGGGPGAVGLP